MLVQPVKTFCRLITYKSYCIIKLGCEHLNLGEITVFLTNSWKRKPLEPRRKKKKEREKKALCKTVEAWISTAGTRN